MAVATPDAAQLVTTMLSALSASVEAISFTTEGQRLLAILTVIAIAFSGIKSLISNESYSDVISNLITIIFTWGFASFIIGINGAGAGYFLGSLKDGFDYLASRIIATPDLGATLGKMLFAASSLFEISNSSSSGGLISSITDGVASTIDAVTSGGMMVANWGMRLFIAVLIVVSALLYAGQYIITQLMFSIGVVLAPIMVPWMMFKTSEFISTGWMKFMIIAGMQKVIGAMLLQATMGTINQATDLATTQGGTAEANFYIYSVVLLVIGINAYLMMQVVSISQSLFSGFGMGKFQAPNKMTPGGATNSAGGVASGAASAGYSTLKGGVQGSANGARAAAAAGKSEGMGRAMGAISGAVAGARGKPPQSNLPKPAPAKSSGGSGGGAGAKGGTGAKP